MSTEVPGYYFATITASTLSSHLVTCEPGILQVCPVIIVMSSSAILILKTAQKENFETNDGEGNTTKMFTCHLRYPLTCFISHLLLKCCGIERRGDGAVQDKKKWFGLQAERGAGEELLPCHKPSRYEVQYTTRLLWRQILQECFLQSQALHSELHWSPTGAFHQLQFVFDRAFSWGRVPKISSSPGDGGSFLASCQVLSYLGLQGRYVLKACK